MAWPSSLARTKNWGTEILTDTDLEGQFDLIIDYINDMMNATTGHKHDATTGEGPKITTANIDDAAGTAGDVYTNTSGTTVGRVAIGTASQLLAVNSGATAPEWVSLTWDDLPDGSVVQQVRTDYATASSGTTAIPLDDTIPQNTEGDEYFTVAITPKATTNWLLITVTAHIAHGSTGAVAMLALFQDATASALAAATKNFVGNNNALWTISFQHEMAAGTTSETTFKVRGGANTGTFYINSDSGGRELGGALISGITVQEIKAS